MKILVQKVRIINEKPHGQQMGQIRPLFKTEDDNDNFIHVEENEYPNNGQILVFNYNKLNEVISSDYFYITNDFFINNFENSNSDDPNFSVKKITYNQGIQHYFKEISLLSFTPIYNNILNINTLRLRNFENIKNNIFFIENDNEIYGPFERNGFQLKGIIFQDYENEISRENFEIFLEQYSTYDGELFFKYNSRDVESHVLIDSDNNKYIINFGELVNKGELNVVSDRIQILEWAEKKIGHIIPDFDSIKTILFNKNLNIHSEIEEIKWKEFLRLLNENDLDETSLNKVKESLRLKDKTLDFDNAELQKIKQDNEQEKQKLLKIIDDKGDEIVSLKQEITLIKNSEKTEKEDRQDILEQYPDLKNFLKDDETIQKTIQILNADQTIVHLQAKKEILEKDIKNKEKDQDTISSAVEKIKSIFNQSKVEHTAKLAEAKIYTDLLNGMDISFSNKPLSEEFIYTPNIIKNKNNTLEHYVLEIQSNLKLQGRDLDFNDVANLIVTTDQSFLTIFAGAPGVGKTSLVDKYSKALGLSENFGYLEIPCAKGWSSSKDLIGFHNPLTNKFQASRTKLKEALQNSSNHKNSPYLVLLDEANLSPMEHYWSDFIKLADFDYQRIIKISDKINIEFGKGFRFLSTINHDHTTEVLSNRLLDRAAIIQIEKPKINKNITFEDIVFDTIYDTDDTSKLFKVTEKWQRNEKPITNTLNLIVDKLESNYSGIIVSPRKHNAIINYSKIGTGLLKGNDFIALDYAVAQHLFPLINIRGDYESVLEEVKNILHDLEMTKSKDLLDKIIKRGKEFKHFKYVYY